MSSWVRAGHASANQAALARESARAAFSQLRVPAVFEHARLTLLPAYPNCLQRRLSASARRNFKTFALRVQLGDRAKRRLQLTRYMLQRVDKRLQRLSLVLLLLLSEQDDFGHRRDFKLRASAGAVGIGAR